MKGHYATADLTYLAYCAGCMSPYTSIIRWTSTMIKSYNSVTDNHPWRQWKLWNCKQFSFTWLLFNTEKYFTYTTPQGTALRPLHVIDRPSHVLLVQKASMSWIWSHTDHIGGNIIGFCSTWAPTLIGRGGLSCCLTAYLGTFHWFDDSGGNWTAWGKLYLKTFSKKEKHLDTPMTICYQNSRGIHSAQAKGKNSSTYLFAYQWTGWAHCVLRPRMKQYRWPLQHFPTVVNLSIWKQPHLIILQNSDDFYFLKHATVLIFHRTKSITGMASILNVKCLL